MYVMVIILFQMGQHKIASDQMIYPSMDMCEVARVVVMENLEKTKPSEDSFALSKCTTLSFEENGPNVKL